MEATHRIHFSDGKTAVFCHVVPHTFPNERFYSAMQETNRFIDDRTLGKPVHIPFENVKFVEEL